MDGEVEVRVEVGVEVGEAWLDAPRPRRPIALLTLGRPPPFRRVPLERASLERTLGKTPRAPATHARLWRESCCSRCALPPCPLPPYPLPLSSCSLCASHTHCACAWAWACAHTPTLQHTAANLQHTAATLQRGAQVQRSPTLQPDPATRPPRRGRPCNQARPACNPTCRTQYVLGTWRQT